MSLPTEIYVWDEAPKEKTRELNIECDGARPTPDPMAKEPLRAGVYRLVREVEISARVEELVIKQAVDVSLDRFLK